VLGVVDRFASGSDRIGDRKSATMARFSSGVAPRTSRTWSNQLLPKMHTAGVSAPTIATRLGSFRRGCCDGEFEPKATSFAFFQGIDLAAAKKSGVLGVRTGPPALDVGQPEFRPGGGRS